MTLPIIGTLACLVLAAFTGGLLGGIDRRLTARLQSRQGPPILQPFLDVAKLLGKTPSVTNAWIVPCAILTLASTAVALAILLRGGDLLLILFVLAAGAVFQTAGALCVPSPYSHLGAHRELLLMLVHEPILILVFTGIAMCTGSFSVADVFREQAPLLPRMPLCFLALGYALTIRLRKSPFDFAASPHAHQELVRGLLTEYAGPYLALLEIAHWLETVLLLGVCALLWHTSLLGMAMLALGSFLAEILLDNATARLTWQWMVRRMSPLAVMGLALVNLLWLYVA
ncbi:MAG: NADH-quinone oxidoreductase subunit H [Desulfovibrio sp.]|jgi:ech hydrogenase subunit B|nr:NADH-quinone oxidoreductase subunit H [Desulfovibrio sp.]